MQETVANNGEGLSDAVINWKLLLSAAALRCLRTYESLGLFY